MRVFAAGAATVVMFLLVQLGALALVAPFESAGYQTVENPSDPANSIFYIGVLLAFTALMLVVIKFDVQWILRGFIIFTSGLISLYVFTVVFPVVPVDLGGVTINALAWGAAALVAVALYVYPEWYVIDGAGVIMGAGSAGLFGISFGILPAIVLLSVLAVYDAISVYGTEHMLTLAEGVMDLRIPVILVVPLTLSYSFLAEDEGEERADDAAMDAETPAPGGADAAGTETTDPDSNADADAGGHESPEFAERDAFFIGLGDAVMPTVMVASAAFFAGAPDIVLAGLTLNLPALLAMVGTMLGLVALLWLVMKGRAHAGLPLLNGGAIGGYLLGAVVSGIPLVQALGLGPYL